MASEAPDDARNAIGHGLKLHSAWVARILRMSPAEPRQDGGTRIILSHVHRDDLSTNDEMRAGLESMFPEGHCWELEATTNRPIIINLPTLSKDTVAARIAAFTAQERRLRAAEIEMASTGESLLWRVVGWVRGPSGGSHKNSRGNEVDTDLEMQAFPGLAEPDSTSGGLHSASPQPNGDASYVERLLLQFL
ncbi:hypothetical protein B0T17DRAFT_616981 [Bombardia bombarda]|uniref:Uncharacterized protein n=1 Tax=Bombardia bombarda TaxID=252184 RepID=A0AA40C4V3_9PEZI|nr:hypothetical protein B0T17DRAFT_616981 [Bombardia bombarda]